MSARNSSFTYKGQAINIKKVGQELGVRYVLEGSVRKAGERVRITAQLIDAQSGNHVWADRYDGRLENIFDLQDEITNAIAAAVTPAFARAELQRMRRKRPENLDAWELALRARQAYASGGPSDLAEARDLAQRALLLDSRNTAALSLLSMSHATEALLGYSTSPSASVAEAVKAARSAVREDSADAECLASLGFALLGARQFDEALDLLRQAVTLNPNSAWGFGVYGACLSWCGEYAKCIEVFDKAMRLSPREPTMGMWFSLLALAAFITGHHQEAVAHARRSVQFNPGFRGGAECWPPVWRRWTSWMRQDARSRKSCAFIQDPLSRPCARGCRFSMKRRASAIATPWPGQGFRTEGGTWRDGRPIPLSIAVCH